MYCSTCGASVPAGRGACDTCGSAVLDVRRDSRAAALEQPFPAVEMQARAIAVCPRCQYHGQGIPYFNRGPHVAALLGATLFTLPYAFGAGGLLYYGMRHDHRVCPRCGEGWGKFGRAARRLDVPEPVTGVNRPTRPAAADEGVRRTWSVILFVLGALMLAVGTVELELMLLALGVLATAGGVVLYRAANRAREERRAQLIQSLQTPVLKLAAERNGVLTVTEVAASLGWTLRRAEKVLQSMDDGWRVNSDVTDDGVIVYEFRELLLGRGPPPEEEEG